MEGFWQADDAMQAPSVTNRFFTSWHWLCAFSTVVFGSRPIRAVPISWIVRPGGVSSTSVCTTSPPTDAITDAGGRTSRGTRSEYTLRTVATSRRRYYVLGKYVAEPELDCCRKAAEQERRIFGRVRPRGSRSQGSAGGRVVASWEVGTAPGRTSHEMGTARMGRDPKTSVLNAHNQCHDVKNLFVTDGACMASSANQNPSITYMALTARAAAYAVEAMKRNEL